MIHETISDNMTGKTLFKPLEQKTKKKGMYKPKMHIILNQLTCSKNSNKSQSIHTYLSSYA